MANDPLADAEDLTRTDPGTAPVGRAWRVIAACNQAMLRAADERSLFEGICRAIVDTGGYRLAWVGYVEHDAQRSIRPVASRGFEHGYLESVGFSWAEDSERGQGPSGTSVRTGAPAVATNTLADPQFKPWRLEARRRGYSSCISLPLRAEVAIVGVLVIYAAEPDAFGKDEVRLLTQAADDLSYGVGALRARAEQARLKMALRRSEGWLRAALQGSLDALLLLRPVHDEAGDVVDFEFLDVNPRAEKMLRQPRDTLVANRISIVLPTLYKELIGRYMPVLETGAPLEERFSIHVPAGRTVWVRHQVVPIEDGVAVILRDITERVTASQKLRDSEKNYRELLQSLQEGIIAVETAGRINFVNKPMAQMLGYDVEEMRGRPFLDFVEERLRESVNQRWEERKRGLKERYTLELRRKDGTPIILDLEAAPRYDDTGAIVGSIAGVMDITARVKAEEALRASLANLAKAEELAHLGTWSYERASRDYRISAEMQRILGVPFGTSLLSTDAVLRLFHADERSGAQEDLVAMLGGRAVRNERRIVRPDGEERVLLFQSEPVRDRAGRVVRVDGFAQDVTERKRYEARLEYLATHDALTALPNRRVLEDRMAQTIAHLARTPGELLAVLYLDLDRFKLVNDSMGHSLGDELLKNVARMLQANVRQGDTVARQGGDEFIVLLRDIRQPSDVMAIVEKIQRLFARPLSIQGRELYATFSMGVSLYPTDGEDIETLLKNADAAMYRAKQSGGGVQFYTHALSRQAAERVQLENDLRHALDDGDFELHYQPQVALADGRIVGAEALIRWNHPREGAIPPSRFIPVAEDAGLVGPIGDWVLQTACKDNQRWRATGLAPIRVAVNVAASQFHNGRVENLILEMKERDALGSDSLELEITERVVMSDARDAIERLTRLKALGIDISIDDFGTGYSSLAYLRRLPVDRIKIDQTFVRDLASNADAQTLVSAIIDLSHAFGFRVIAEGVETEAQLMLLARRGCDEAQGYFLARPMPARDFERLLRMGCVALPTADSLPWY